MMKSALNLAEYVDYGKLSCRLKSISRVPWQHRRDKYALTASDFGDMADTKATDAVFSNCIRKSFVISDICALLGFIKDSITAAEIGMSAAGAEVGTCLKKLEI